MRTIIKNGTLITPDEVLPAHTLLLEDGVISAITADSVDFSPADTVIDASGQWITPGLIDIHVHGGVGRDVMDATPEALREIAKFMAQHGVTSYLPTTVASGVEETMAAIHNVGAIPQPAQGAHHLGIHLEGPYLSAEYKGAQPEHYLRDADPEEYTRWLETGLIRLVTLAPERANNLEFIKQGIRVGVEFALGHTNATYDEVREAANRGLRQATHTFNGMRGLHHREPGTLGAVLTDNRIYAQVIADGIHVHPAAVKLLVCAKGPSRTILVTDAMRAAGLGDGEYDLGGQTISVKGGVARTAAGGLAGSTITMDAALRNIQQFANISLREAVTMVTRTPAEAMGWLGQKGTLAAGSDADVVLWDAALDVTVTIIGGQIAHQRTSLSVS